MITKLIIEGTPDELRQVLATEAVRGLSTPNAQPPTEPGTKAPDPSIPQDAPQAQAPVAPTVDVPLAPTPSTSVVPFPAASVPPVTGNPITPPAPVVQAPAAMPATYTPEQINEACRPLMDAGRTAELQAAMREHFGVNSLRYLNAEQLAQFAVILRGLGAQI